MEYHNIIVTIDAEEDLERFVRYLIVEKKNLQAAKNLLDDYDATIESLKSQAASVGIPQD